MDFSFFSIPSKLPALHGEEMESLTVKLCTHLASLLHDVHTRQAGRDIFLLYCLEVYVRHLYLEEAWCQMSNCCKSCSRPFLTQLYSDI